MPPNRREPTTAMTSPSRAQRHVAPASITFFIWLALPLSAAPAQTTVPSLAPANSVQATLTSAPTGLPQAPSALAAAGSPGFLRTLGGSVVPQATPGPLPLSLDDAIAFALKTNQQLEQLRIQDRLIRGEILGVENYLLPSVTASARSTAQEINLAAMGFKPGSLTIPGVPANAIPTIVKVNTTAAQLNVNQTVFNLPDLYLYRAAQKAASASALGVLNGRGAVTLAVGTQYLKALADAAQIADTTALLQADTEVLRQATLSHDAGVSPNVDVLRARVQQQVQQQAVIQAQTTFEKDKISLNRLMGLPAEQQLTLTDIIPFADLPATPLPEALAIAYVRRKDLLTLQAEVAVSERELKAARYEYLPSLAVNGFYGVLGETTGLYHGVFNAEGSLRIPIFREAQFRGEREVANAQLRSLNQQIASLHDTIEQQIRASMLDIQSSAELVRVAGSNVALANDALADTVERFRAGVDDSLPVVRAQATLADAQTRLIAATLQHNQAKLALARNMGVIESQYRSFLGR